MVLRLTDGSQYELTDCKQECEPETGDNLFICTLSQDYDFEELTKTLKKDEIAEILTILEDGKITFQTKNYKNVKSVTNDIMTKDMKIIFNSK